jgi:hypothetical protein
MFKEALQFITGLVPATRYDINPESLDTAFFDKAIHRAPDPRQIPLAKALEVATLRSFSEYLKANRDALQLESHAIHVVSPSRVELVSKLEPWHRRREVPIVATYSSGVEVLLDKLVDLESMTIGLMAMFTEQGDRAEVLAFLKSIRSENQEVREDDGFAQTVVVKAGVQAVDRKTTPNPVTLAPFRTFPEIEQQPASLFVLRLKAADGGVGVLLKAADGNAWKVAAVKAVADKLAELLGADAPAILY